ncbi:beta-ketoacyl synthase [Sporocytophaga myxococcoides]|uniref:Beta-ketoacyl synthase n=2 Tax=Sporocytophaga myxococcoides TaxID=153721 RepID=A0A098L999_9BACT|nr:beta-ketoacyl synthase [Sporocytophaga myxococcoides]
MLISKKTGISHLSGEELNELGISQEKVRSSNFVNAGSVIDHPYDWDASFFGYSPKVAAIIDPQQRLSLECAWELIEQAGYSPLNIKARTGVYLSVANNNYAHRYRSLVSQSDDYIAFTSNDADFASTRISYHLNLKGPSMTIETACSSSLVAVHMACESLLNHESEMAICGGASILFPQAGYIYDPNLIFSPDGHCRPFDKNAKGTVFGNGIGLILLKRIKNAIDDGDNILAIIKGSAVNNDGKVKNSFYSPSPEGQKKVIREALAVSGIPVESLGFIEAHGTATPIGDPIEIEALAEVFREATSEKTSCYIGSVKSNLGHLNKAAGIAGLIKTVLALQNRMIPATLNFTSPNPEIDFSETPFLVNPDAIDWKSGPFPRRAGVSSFGVGGTNAHIILEEAPLISEPPSDQEYYILPLSAKNEEYLSLYKKTLAEYLKKNTSLTLQNIAYTLQESRTDYTCRDYVICNSRDQFIQWLNGNEIISEENVNKNILSRWKEGSTCDWKALRNKSKGLRKELPGHPMKRSCHHIDDYTPQEPAKHNRLMPLIEENISTFRRQIFRTNFSQHEYLIQEHNFILPAAAYLEMITESVKLSGEDYKRFGLKDVIWKQAFSLRDHNQKPITLTLHHSGQEIHVNFSTGNESSDRSLAEGTFFQLQDNLTKNSLPSLFSESESSNTLSGNDIYSLFNNSGFRYGEHFRLIEKISRQKYSAIATINFKYNSPDKNNFIIDPLLVDAAFQTAVTLLPSFDTSLELFVPYQLKEASFYKLPGDKVKIITQRLTQENTTSPIERFNITILDENNETCMTFTQLELVQWNRSQSKTKTREIENDSDKQTTEEIEKLLKQVVSEELGYELDSFSNDESFETLGLDSVILVNVINKLDKNFPGLPKTLFLEYPNIAEAALYIVDTYKIVSKSISEKAIEEKDQLLSKQTNSYKIQPITVKAMGSTEEQFQYKQNKDNDIAIIGVHGMYPEAGNLESFWENLKSAKDCIREIPRDRWPIEGFYSPDANKTDTSTTKWGGFIDKIEYFDPLFFKIAPKEASYIDPQERLFLESAWCCVENAGYTPKNMCDENRKVGVYAGVMWGHYQLFAMEEYARGEIVVNSSNYWSIANRVSFTMNFNGPSMAVDTACSSSLSAIHLACQSIISGESDLAIAGGVNLNLHPYKHYILAARKFAATDGRCRSFGEGGSGYVPGEGVGTVLLKPLSKAIQDKDFIHAVIKGSAVNHGGKVSGFTVPNSSAQASVVKTAFSNAGIKPSDISYIEAHGTGTSLGDPIEINGLTRAYADSNYKPENCPIGSVKSNIGHLESAAGVASIHKVILQLNHKTLVPSIHNEPVNPYIDFVNSPFRIQKKIEEWKPSTTYSKRLAGISSFGAGGSNAHLVVEEANQYRSEYKETEHLSEHAIILSAQDESALLAYASRMVEYINNPGYSELSLSAIAFTLQTGRISMEHRLAFTANSLQQIREKLQSFMDGNRNHVIVSKPDKTAALPSSVQIAEFLKNKDISELIRAWSIGANINWTLLYQNNIPGRIPLPYYPFNKRRLWYKNLEPNEPMASILGDSRNNKNFYSTTPSETITKQGPINPIKAINDSGLPLNYFQLSLKEAPIASNTNKRESACILFSQNKGELDALRKYYNSEIKWIKSENELSEDFSGYSFPLQKSNTYALLYNELSASIRSQEIDILIHADSFFSPDYKFLIDLFRHIKQLSETFKKQKINILIYWTTANKNEAAYKAAGSFAKVVAKENSRINIKTTEFRNILSPDGRAENIIKEFNNNGALVKRESIYINNNRFEYSVGPMIPVSGKSEVTIKPGGIYLITGGMGSIGLATSRLLISLGAQKVILSGRKPVENLTVTQKDLLDKSNGKLSYHAADIADPISAQILISSIVKQHGKLNGVIHSAGIVDDKLLLKKSEESFNNVTGAKIKGAFNLDRALTGAQPDFVIFYSSVSAVAGQMGQSDYSTANRFLDEFVSYKNLSSPVKYISVNWPYWNEGGMKLATPYIDMMRNSGIDGISDQEGMQALQTILKSGNQQVIVFKGDEKGCKGFFNDTHFEYSSDSWQSITVKAKEEKIVTPQATSILLKEEIKDIIISVLSEAIGLSSDEIDSTANLEEYGVDSVAIMKVTSELEKLFPELSIALFFECKSINDIVQKISTELSEGTLSYQGNSIHSKTITEPLKVTKSSETKNGTSIDISTVVRTKITDILSDALGLSPEEVDPYSDMEEYGVDSVAIMKVTSELEKLFPEVSIALFFECKSINDIVSRITDEVNNGTLTYSETLNPPLLQQSDTTPAQAFLSDNNYSEILTTKVKTVIKDVLSEALGIPANELSISIPLDEYGVDSVAIMKVTSELEKLFSGISIALFFECKTINDISEKIKEELTSGNLIYLLNDLKPAVSLNTIDINPITSNIVNEVNVSDEIRNKITGILTEALGLKQEEIDNNVNLEEYGVDSVVIMKVTSELEKLFPELSIALFFECKSIDDIVSKINEELKSGTLTYTRLSVAHNSQQSNELNKQFVKKPYFVAGTVSHQGVITKVPVTLHGMSEELADHVINGQVIFAGAGYLDLVKKISDNTLDEKINTFRNISWFAPLIAEREDIPVEIDFTDKGDFRQYIFKSVQKQLAKGEVKAEAIAPLSISSIPELISGSTSKINSNDIYHWFNNNKFHYGPSFSTIEELYVSEGRVTGRLKTPYNKETWLSPMILDGIFQCVAGFSFNSPSTTGELWVPFFIEKLSIHSEAMPSELWVRVEKDSFTKDVSLQQFNIFLIDQYGRVYLDIKNFTLKYFTSKKDKAKDTKGSVSSNRISDTLNTSTDKPAYAFSPSNAPEPIAVIAASCKFPGADSPQEFWKNLVEEKDVVQEIPIDRWDYRNSFDSEKGKKGKTYSKWGGFINNISAFDNEFFKIKENDAMCLDPQQRILLELTQQLFDQAGYTKAEIANKNIAVITGGASGQWGELIDDMDGDLKRNVIVNTIQNMISARISDFYDLKGTSLTIDTACSSSLVAVHEACQKIRLGECEMAIAGGITLLLADGGHIGFSQAEVLSPEGKCNVFDKNANGIVLGEGAGIVLLKSYKKALQDGDQICAVIRGSAVNNDGKTMGLTTPNMLMQKEVIKMALDNSGVDRKSITYLEAHGTGTLLGDPIEVKAAGQIYGAGNLQKQYCAIASVKANVGHLLHASGVASLIKVSMALKHKVIPASLNCKNPHPRFEFENSPFYPVTATKPWETESQPRRAAISSFGFGGTNCHMILEETDPSYVPTRKPLPPTKFKKKRFWPGYPVEPISESVKETSLYDRATVKNIIGYSEILEKLEKGLITVEEAIQFEKSLK